MLNIHVRYDVQTVTLLCYHDKKYFGDKVKFAVLHMLYLITLVVWGDFYGYVFGLHQIFGAGE